MARRELAYRQRVAVDAGIAEKCLTQWPGAQTADPVPRAAQAGARQHAVGKYHRRAIALQQHLAQIGVLAAAYAEQRGFIKRCTPQRSVLEVDAEMLAV